jgi:hypothetical protein
MKEKQLLYLQNNKKKITLYLRDHVFPILIGGNTFYLITMFNTEVYICLDGYLEDRTMSQLILNYKKKEIVFL